ncbi:MAG: rRNA maturation RNase YbeY [Chthoniobacterales bacterium]
MQFTIPKLVWSRRQRKIKFHFEAIQEAVKKALPFCLEKPRYPNHQLPQMIEVTFLNDRSIAQIHAQFLQDPTPTDVITFSYGPELGEILIGIPTVAMHAKQFHQSIDHEVTRCVIHGLLHLLGYDDRTTQEHRMMHDQQEAILKKIYSTTI